MEASELTIDRCKVLIIGHSFRTRAELSAYLGSRGITVVAQGFDDVSETARLFEPDVAVVELAGDDPGRAIGAVRAASHIPVVLLVDRGLPSTVRIAALEQGASDILEAPPSPEELALRILAISRRVEADNYLRVHDVVIDTAGYMAWRGGSLVDLTATEFRVLEMLVRNVGVVLSKPQLLSAVWGYEHFDVNLVEVHVCALRRKLEQFGPRLIDTVRSLGYVIRRGEPATPGIARSPDVRSLVPA